MITTSNLMHKSGKLILFGFFDVVNENGANNINEERNKTKLIKIKKSCFNNI